MVEAPHEIKYYGVIGCPNQGVRRAILHLSIHLRRVWLSCSHLLPASFHSFVLLHPERLRLLDFSFPHGAGWLDSPRMQGPMRQTPKKIDACMQPNTIPSRTRPTAKTTKHDHLHKLNPASLVLRSLAILAQGLVYNQSRLTYRGIACCTPAVGDSVSLWNDLLLDSIFSIKFANLFELSKNKSISLASARSQDNLIDLFRIPMTRDALNELQVLQGDLLSLQSSATDLEVDVWAFIWGTSTYNSRRYYQHQFACLTPPKPLKWIWKSKCVPVSAIKF